MKHGGNAPGGSRNRLDDRHRMAPSQIARSHGQRSATDDDGLRTGPNCRLHRQAKLFLQSCGISDNRKGITGGKEGAYEPAGKPRLFDPFRDGPLKGRCRRGDCETASGRTRFMEACLTDPADWNGAETTRLIEARITESRDDRAIEDRPLGNLTRENGGDGARTDHKRLRFDDHALPEGGRPAREVVIGHGGSGDRDHCLGGFPIAVRIDKENTRHAARKNVG